MLERIRKQLNKAKGKNLIPRIIACLFRAAGARLWVSKIGLAAQGSPKFPIAEKIKPNAKTCTRAPRFSGPRLRAVRGAVIRLRKMGISEPITCVSR